MAYQIKINVNDTPEQEIFMSFQCSVLSAPIIENDNILFKSQVIEFNGKNRTEIPITCVCPTHNLRIFSKMNKLQKGNKIDIMANLIKNNEEIIVEIIYIVYAGNTNNISSADKKDLSRIPWLNSSGLKKENNNDLFENTSNNLPDFIYKYNNENKETEDKVIEISDNAEGMENFLMLFYFKKNIELSFYF